MSDDAVTIRAMNKTLVRHGALVLLIAFGAGIGLSMVAMGEMEGSVNDWRIAHMEGLVNGMFLFLVVGLRSTLDLSLGQHRVMTWCFVLMAYCNTVFGWLKGIYGVGGMSFDAPLANQLATAAGSLGVPVAIVGVVLLLMGALRKS
jgi:hypothetical protein